MIRKAVGSDIQGVVQIYDEILNLEAARKGKTGWVKGIFPSEKSAMAALEDDELYVMEQEGKIVASARINHTQVPAYAKAQWNCTAPDEEIMVMHTLSIAPEESRKGYATAFVKYCEALAAEKGCKSLRMDANEINTPARNLYTKLGYKEAGIVFCNFNGIKDVRLVCMEKDI